MKKKSIRVNQGLSDDPQWYKDGIIYEVRVRSFFDSNGDGVGDFLGLASKLDYLEDLGVTALWLLPFYPSPGRDDGYDISDYLSINPEIGTIADFQYLLGEAHKRGIRIITELVINHTSDQHPWFQRARRAPAGSPERDFYVWSDTTEKYADARIIFKDFEPSNWSWDPIAKSHYWHRFFSHQPDLNFENPAVEEAVFAAMDFWLALGVDGLRLDAVPYLYESDGTNCENLPKTHALLKRLRAHVDAKFPNRMLLAEANQWPEDAAAYFGKGDECHMNFHFPIMPRMFMAIHMEDRFPIIDILAQTPPLEPGCQWAMFLRNHDELTLEMVTDEERDYMYRAYANDSAMRINLGIRRRLAPLVGNDRRKMELLNGLLHALPGTPVLYYGDEIGMGDNVFLGDRNGVRTPMQWSADRNAGFSRVNPQRLILPIIIDPDYHYESINVEAQQNNPHSLLWWTKRIIALRKNYRAFGRGSFEFLQPSNPRVLAFIREFEGETVLVVANLSRLVQFVELDLSKFKGATPIEMFGQTRFPDVGDGSYLLTLGGHAFYWFALEHKETDEVGTRLSMFDPTVIECSSPDALLYGEERELLEQALPEFLGTRRWLQAGGRRIVSAHISESIPFGAVDQRLTVCLVRVEFSEGESATYVLPLVVAIDTPSSQAQARPRPPMAVVVQLRITSGSGEPQRAVLLDALEDPASSSTFLDAIAKHLRFRGQAGEAVAAPLLAVTPASELGEARNVSGDHRSAAIQYGDKYILKVFRRMEGGTSPELEIGKYLGAVALPPPAPVSAPSVTTSINPPAPPLTPRVAGYIEYLPGRAEAITLAVLQEYVPNEGTAWHLVNGEIRRFFERAVTTYRHVTPPPRQPSTLLAQSRAPIPQAVAEAVGAFVKQCELLGQRTAELHIALARPDDPSFGATPYSTFDQRSKYQSLRNLVGMVTRGLRSAPVPDVARRQADSVSAGAAQVLKAFEPLITTRLTAMRIRGHGDYHLGQVLFTGRDFVIIDLEGNPALPLSERRRRRSCLRDVANMAMSFQYAAYGALLDSAIVRDGDRALMVPWAHHWQLTMTASFVAGYLGRAGHASFVPTNDAELELLLDAALVEAAYGAVGTELNLEKAATGDSARAAATARLAIPLYGLGLRFGIEG